jgi:hypothetical protein
MKMKSIDTKQIYNTPSLPPKVASSNIKWREFLVSLQPIFSSPYDQFRNDGSSSVTVIAENQYSLNTWSMLISKVTGLW